MTDILPPAGWPNVRQLETNEFATGGANGNMNEQAKSLAARSELLKQYAALPYESKTGGYALNERVQLSNGDIVKSTIDGNTNDPNVDMTWWVNTNSATNIKYSSGLSVQDEYNKRATKSISNFGGDITGINPSDTAIVSGLEWSASTGGVLELNGKIRVTQTVNQPKDSKVLCSGIVFCEDASDLTDGWLWDVNHGGGVDNTTMIFSLVLSTSPVTVGYVNRDMKGLRVRSPHVKVGVVHTYGCLDGGVEFGPIGYEIFADTVTCNIGAYKTNLGATGFKISTTDCGVQNVVTVGYPIGANLGSANFADNVHVWGYPATNNANEYANKQMLTGIIFGTSTRANYVYTDTPDTALYDTPPSDDTGMAVVFNGWESSVGAFYVRIHPQTKANKIKLIKYKGFDNSIGYIHPGSRFNTDSPIIYNTPDLQWRNNITYFYFSSILINLCKH